MKTSEPFRSLDMDAEAADLSLIGYRLALLRQVQNIAPEQQAEALGIDRERLTTLYSGRLPRDQAELELIASDRLGGWKAGWAVGCPLYRESWQVNPGLYGVRYILGRHNYDLV